MGLDACALWVIHHCLFLRTADGVSQELRLARTANTGVRLHGSSPGGELGGCLEDVPRDNDGHQRSTTVSPSLGMTSADRSDQHRLDAWSLDGMGDVRAAAYLALTCASAPAQTRPQQARIAFGVPHVEL